MQILSPFDAFDPKSLKHAGRVPVMLQSSLEKAQHLLNKRSRDEIESILKDINWMFHHPLPEPRSEHLHNLEPTSIESLGKDLAESFDEAFGKSPGELLLDCVGQPHIENNPDRQKATWPEYFSVLALALIGDVACMLSNPNNGQHEQFTIVGLSGEAGQAITIAEQLLSDAEQGEITSQEVKAAHKLRTAGRKGGKQRHAMTNRIIRYFFRFYDRTFLPRFDNSEKTPKKIDAINEFYRLHIPNIPAASVDPEAAHQHFEKFKRMIYTALKERDARKIRQ